MFEKEFEPATVIAGVDDDIQRYRARCSTHFLERQPDALAKLEKEMEERAVSLRERLAAYSTTRRVESERAQVAEVQKELGRLPGRGRAEYLPPPAAPATRPRPGPTTQPLGKRFHDLNMIVDQLTVAGIAEAHAEAQHTGAVAASAQQLGYLVTIIGLIAAALIGALLARSIVGPLGRMQGALESVATGKLNQEIPVDGHAEVSAMASSLRKAFLALRGLLQNVARDAGALTTASSQIATVSQQMAATPRKPRARPTWLGRRPSRSARTSRPWPPPPRRWRRRVKEIAKNASEAAKVANTAVKAAEKTDASIAKLGEVEHRDRQGDQGDHRHRRADQPAGPERDHRGGPRRRGGQGLRGGGQRGEGAGQGDRQGHRGHQPEDRGDPGATRGRGPGHRPDRRDHQADQRHPGTIASAVEEQTATTNEIARNIAEAAKGSTEIARNIIGRRDGGQSTTTGARRHGKKRPRAVPMPRPRRGSRGHRSRPRRRELAQEESPMRACW